MAHPGRPRGRMNKKTQQAQAAAAAAQAQAAAQARSQAAARAHLQAQNRIKEEPGVQAHDDADLISYRTDALNRFINNHEYIENITMKMIHTNKIIPPSLFPTIPKRNPQDFKNLQSDDIYYGDLEYMKLKTQALEDEIKSLKDNKYLDKYIPSDEKYNFEKEQVEKLSQLQSNLHSHESIDELESELDNILQAYKSKFNYMFQTTELVKKYSVSIEDVQVQSAPENYNPKSISSFINGIPMAQGPISHTNNGNEINNNIAINHNNNIIPTNPNNGTKSSINNNNNNLNNNVIGNVNGLSSNGETFLASNDTDNFNPGNVFLSQFEDSANSSDFGGHSNGKNFSMSLLNSSNGSTNGINTGVGDEEDEEDEDDEDDEDEDEDDEDDQDNNASGIPHNNDNTGVVNGLPGTNSGNDITTTNNDNDNNHEVEDEVPDQLMDDQDVDDDVLFRETNLDPNQQVVDDDDIADLINFDENDDNTGFAQDLLFN
ncbi:uncharacterized protein RJT21DRAFT_113715 [Scheffersomyces amazonensis]|uniref:uncharacterized protein n=1 Tax=Scheffersomyces amazonensis TaxID=1078765 RepID=UPI00315C6CB0